MITNSFSTAFEAYELDGRRIHEPPNATNLDPAERNLSLKLKTSHKLHDHDLDISYILKEIKEKKLGITQRC